MESLVVTLDTAKKLKAAGFPQQALHHWHTDEDGLVELKSGNGFTGAGLKHHESFTAPTAQEIADQLRQLLKGQRFEMQTTLRGYVARVQQEGDVWNEADTMAEALALLYLKLKEAK